MKARIKTTLKQIESRDDAEGAMRALASLENNRRLLLGRRDEEILKINQTFEGGLVLLGQQIAVQFDALRLWAEGHPEEFPKDRKSVVLLSGVLGYRTGTPKLALLSRTWTWIKVVCALKGAGLQTFVRLKEEVDKEGLLAAHSTATNKVASAGQLQTVGLKVVQEETFFVEPDLSKFEERQVAAANQDGRTK